MVVSQGFEREKGGSAHHHVYYNKLHNKCQGLFMPHTFESFLGCKVGLLLVFVGHDRPVLNVTSCSAAVYASVVCVRQLAAFYFGFCAGLTGATHNI